MDFSAIRRRRGAYRQLFWMPRGPAGIALFIVALAAIIALLVLLSVVLLTAAIAGGIAFAVYQGVRGALRGNSRQSRRAFAGRARRAQADAGRPLEQYLSDIEAYDHLTTRVLQFDLDGVESWRGQRRLARIADEAAELRESTLAVERAVTQDRTADAARPGLWELIVAVTELQRCSQDLLAFPSSRGRAAQTRELQVLQDRRHEIGRRRDNLVRRLQDVDLRDAGTMPS